MQHVSRVSIFLKVAELNSFAAAARDVGMTGPAVSKQIQALEDTLGVKLLNRTTRHVSLTEAGLAYKEKAGKAVALLEEAEREIMDRQDHPVGTLKINAPQSFGGAYLAEPIAAFAVKYPDLKMEVDFDDRRVDVIAEGYDAVIRIGALEDSSLIARKIAASPLVLCASEAFCKTQELPQVPADLSRIPGITFSKHGNSAPLQFQGQDGRVETGVYQRTLAADSAEMILAACKAGVGIASLPLFAVHRELQSGQLRRIMPDYEIYPARNIYVLYPENRYISTKLRLFVDEMIRLGKTLPWMQ